MAANTNINAQTLPALLDASCARYAGHTAIQFAGRATTFAELGQATDRVAAYLAEQGIGHGDRVALYCINSDTFAQAYFGIQKAGATVVPINLLLNPKEIVYILNNAGVKALVYFEAFAATIPLLQAEVPTLCLSIAVGQKAVDTDSAWSDVLGCTGTPPIIEFNPTDDVAAIIYTSGTTGKPKGAMLTHANLASNTSSVHRALKLVAGEDRILLVLPMFHAFAATAGMLNGLLYGCTIIPLPKFDPEQVADTIAAYGATLFMGVPSMYSTFLRLPGEHTEKFSSLKYCVSGGAAMPEELMRQFENRFGKLIYEGDGPTECSPVTCCNPIGGERKIGSVGLPVPDVEMKILDDEGLELPKNEMGEICVKGPNIMKGYWNHPEETAASFTGEWFRTGDLGHEDDDGYFYIVDRKKDMLIVNGMNVYPRVIEEILYQYEGLVEAAVVGEPNDLHGEIPVAYVCLDKGVAQDAAAIRAFCRDHLGRYQVPRKVHFKDELPKNATGKILKRELRKHGELERGIDSRDSN